jgi:hypothetical protein
MLDPAEPPEQEVVHDNSGKTQIWLLTKGGSSQCSIPESEYGQFYSGDCYLVLYVWNDMETKSQASTSDFFFLSCHYGD